LGIQQCGTAFKKGFYDLLLSFGDYHDNINGDINQAMIDSIRRVKL